MTRARDPLFLALIECLADERTSRADVSVYGCLLNHSRGHSSRPSRIRIARETGVADGSIRRQTRRLAEFGYIAVTPSTGRHTNIYRLLALACRGSEAAAVRGSNPAGVVHDGYLGGNADTQLRTEQSNGNSKSVSVNRSQAEAGRSPPSRGAIRPGADAEDLHSTARNKIKTGSSAVASGSPYAAALCPSGQNRSTAEVSAWGNTDDLAEQLRRDFG